MPYKTMSLKMSVSNGSNDLHYRSGRGHVYNSAAGGGRPFASMDYFLLKSN